MAKKNTTYRPFTWCLIDERRGATPKDDAQEYWHGGNGAYNARIQVTSGAYVIYKTRAGHKEGDLELKRGLALDVPTAKALVDEYVKEQEQPKDIIWTITHTGGVMKMHAPTKEDAIERFKRSWSMVKMKTITSAAERRAMKRAK